MTSASTEHEAKLDDSRGAIMSAEMNEQPNCAERLVARRQSIRESILALQPTKPVGVVVIARGSSLNSSTYLAYAVETMASIPVSLARPSVFTRYQARPDYSGWLAVSISQSGETPEIITATNAIRACGAKVLGISNDPTSTLAHVVDTHLPLEAGDELAVPATKTVTAQMISALVIASAWETNNSELDQQLKKIPAAIDDILRTPEECSTTIQQWVGADSVTVLGRGFGFPAAHETALKIREVAGVLGEAWSVTAFRHGPIAGLPPRVPVLLLTMTAEMDEDTTLVFQELSERQHRIAICGPGATADCSFARHDLGEMLNPILAVVRGQQLCRSLALVRDLNPDAPRGLRKITRTN